ncbi:hypothetical protein LOZ53_006072 [Ophidiomyces ophidiicola]|uniref:uncharacterized protein n=1 Tax=Ophidiomyces ophidiicola TaxID=1387563 RepID=UPI0020C2F19B|nr:uncharacterized protein LOZ57_002038 [Ophidiomyces ophidiicola]KAI1927505.1 hypothetical protein LOZ60_003090 [Ophidiomyces ophidiicola]KAI1950479.1 hypothetical protein LOZ57_002038 [Ophidiomyces ophidiicola]KAI1956627.1 hypothetical protein LOZ59_004229 [Ophidiomyces ophidiicola]KAI1960316.1 hypothetical protein LOZ58_004039 [Ophidiomyces ophidiicola]KAI1981526.1 hypothetical protein LOZ55_000547 [Ophidiomyces ophidiicola]
MFALTVSAILTGVTGLEPTDSEDAPYHYTFKVLCTSCREEHPKMVSFHRWEKHTLSGSRGEANFVWKCGFCNRENSASFTTAPTAYTESQTQQSIVHIDCRGLELTDFQPDGEWQAKGAESNTKFANIDLQDGEWYDYDEKAGEEVSITGLNWEVKRV